MTVIGYIRVSSDKQDLEKQEHLLLKYAQQHDMQVNVFITIEISSRRSTDDRYINELLERLNEGDVLLVTEPSRLGRNVFEVINIINQLSENGVKLVLVRQPELSTAGPHGKSLRALLCCIPRLGSHTLGRTTSAGLNTSDTICRIGYAS